MKTLIRDLLAASLHRLRVTDPAHRSAVRLYIATFHRVLPEEQRSLYPLPGLVVTPDELHWFISYFQHSFDCQRLDAAWRACSRCEPSPRPRLAVTFDDGQLDNYLHAAPVLDRLGVPATFFVPVEAVQRQQLLWHDRMGYAIQRLVRECSDSPLLTQLGLRCSQAAERPRVGLHRAKLWSPAERLRWIQEAEERTPNAAPPWDGMMSWSQLRDLVRRGHEIGSHSYTHPILVQCDDRQLEHEVAASRRRLEEELGTEVRSFCYPNGDCDARVVGAVSRAGYQLAVTTRWGDNRPTDDPYALNRHDMVAESSLDRRGRLSAPRLAMRMAGLVRGVN